MYSSFRNLYLRFTENQPEGINDHQFPFHENCEVTQTGGIRLFKDSIVRCDLMKIGLSTGCFAGWEPVCAL